MRKKLRWSGCCIEWMLLLKRRKSLVCDWWLMLSRLTSSLLSVASQWKWWGSSIKSKQLSWTLINVIWRLVDMNRIDFMLLLSSSLPCWWLLALFEFLQYHTDLHFIFYRCFLWFEYIHYDNLTLTYKFLFNFFCRTPVTICWLILLLLSGRPSTSVLSLFVELTWSMREKEPLNSATRILSNLAMSLQAGMFNLYWSQIEE